MKHTPLVIAFSFLLGLGPAYAQSTHPTPQTPSHQAQDAPSALFSKEEALLALKDLANNPLSPQSGAERRELIKWIDKTPEVDVVICGTAEGFFPKTEAEKGDALQMVLFAQLLFSNAQYQLEHPDVKDEITKQMAGVDGMLNVYRTIKASHPEAVNGYADKLQGLKDTQTLHQYVEQTCQLNPPDNKAGKKFLSPKKS